MVRWKGQLPQIPAMRWLSLTRGGLEPVFKMVSLIKQPSFWVATIRRPPIYHPVTRHENFRVHPACYRDVQWCFVPLRGMIDGSHPASVTVSRSHTDPHLIWKITGCWIWKHIDANHVCFHIFLQYHVLSILNVPSSGWNKLHFRIWDRATKVGILKFVDQIHMKSEEEIPKSFITRWSRKSPRDFPNFHPQQP